MFTKCQQAGTTWTVGQHSVEHWTRQMRTPYADLSEEEKDSDRKEADRFLAIVGPELASLRSALAEARGALEKIAGGNVEPGILTDVLLSDRSIFTSRMFTWCQETARLALPTPAATDEEP